jgi:antitoxin HicB
MAGKSIGYYMSLPYKMEIFPDESGFTAILPELPGCMTSAATFTELWPMILEARRLWLEVALEDGITIPEPKPLEENSVMN